MLVTAMRQATRSSASCSNPLGAAGLAAVLAYRERFKGQRIGTILSGATSPSSR